MEFQLYYFDDKYCIECKLRKNKRESFREFCNKNKIIFEVGGGDTSIYCDTTDDIVEIFKTIQKEYKDITVKIDTDYHQDLLRENISQMLKAYSVTHSCFAYKSLIRYYSRYYFALIHFSKVKEQLQNIGIVFI